MMRQTIQEYYGSDRAAKAIYGAVLIFAYLITQQHSGETRSLTLVFGTLLAAITIVVAEIYSEILGKTIRQKNILSKTQRLEIQKDSFAIIIVSIWPALFFLLNYAGFISVRTAFNIGYTYCLVLLFIFSYWAARLSNHSKRTALVRSFVIVALGVVIVIAKYSFGH